MKAFTDKKETFFYTDIEENNPEKGEVKIKLKSSGLNHRDLKIPARRKGNNDSFLILGSDGAGVIEIVGEGVTEFKEGDEVIINPALGWFENSDIPPVGFEILGYPSQGTFAEKVVVSSAQVEKKPSYLSWEEAGVIALGGVTGYRALFTKGNLQSGQTVFIPGAGGGVATFLIQFAKAKGAKVITTSRSEGKRKKALNLGADIVLDTHSDWKKELDEEVIDLVIESIGEATFTRSLEVLKKGGKMVTFGATTKDEIKIDIRSFFYGQYYLYGTTMGSREELRSMISLMEKHQIHPVIDKIFALKDSKQAFDWLQSGKQFGKVAIQTE